MCPSLVPRILQSVVQEVDAELGRLFSCVRSFSDSGVLQASIDVAALSKACSKISNSSTLNPFSETAKRIPQLKTLDRIE